MQQETGPDMKILIVDDDKVVADILKDLTAEKDRQVDVCYDGLAAIEHIQRTMYDIIIVDLVMPRLDGIEVLRYAKKVYPEVVVIIITGYTS
jgi:two-component system response regulator VicR